MSGRKPINLERVLELRDQFISCRRIGIMLAEEEGRPVAYSESTVANAISQHRLRLVMAALERD